MRDVSERKDPKARREEARQRMYHDLIFDSAEQVFADHGFEAGTMQEIAADAGVSLKTLYATFPGKTELFDEVRAVRTEQFVEAIAAAHDSGDSALEALDRGVRAYVDFLFEHENFLRILLRGGIGITTESVERRGAEGVTKFAEILERGISEGVFYDGDARMLAHLGIAIMQVWLSRIPERGNATAEEISEEILLHMRRALVRPEALAA